MATPEYMVIEPKGYYVGMTLIPRGSKIRTEATPGPHLEPLNEEAHAAYKKWLDFEDDVVDKDGNKTGQRHKPRMMFFKQRYEPLEAETVEVLAGPARELNGTLDLASVLYQKQDTQARPAPAFVAPIEALGTDEVIEVTSVGDKPKVGVSK